MRHPSPSALALIAVLLGVVMIVSVVRIGRPVVIGTSRKSFLGRITGREVDDRVAGTIATNVLAYERGASVFRVHDVRPVHDALAVAAATVSPPWASTTPTSSMMSTT